MKLPRGRLVRNRVVTDPETILTNALDSALTGYARLESQDALLLGADGVGVLTFADGVPVVAYHTGTDNGGESALTDIAVAGPYQLELYELDAAELEPVHETESLCLPPGLPARHLAGNPDLAERTRADAPASRTEERVDSTEESGAVEAFLEDEERVAAIRERAREQAQKRAEEWDL